MRPEPEPLPEPLIELADALAEQTGWNSLEEVCARFGIDPADLQPEPED